MAKQTNDISGQSCETLSPSAVLQQSLESKLRQRMDVNGSPEYVLTWKNWDMQLGPPICALRASHRRNGDTAYFGWPAPATRDYRYPNLKPDWMRARGGKGAQLSNFAVHRSGKDAQLHVLNPALSRWLQGFPQSWDEYSPHFVAWSVVQDAIASAGLRDMAIQSSRNSRTSSLEHS